MTNMADGIAIVSRVEEAELGVLEIDVLGNDGIRFLRPPVAPVFERRTRTGVGPGLAAPGPLLQVAGGAVRDHPGAAHLCGTARGPGHGDFGEPCQDAAASRHIDGHVLLAVADGVSEGSHSGELARAAVEVSLRLMVASCSNTVPVEQFDFHGWAYSVDEHVRAQLAAIASTRPDATGATTVAVALVDLHRGVASTGRIGDSSAWIVGRDLLLRPVLSHRKDGAGFVDSRTAAIPTPPGVPPAMECANLIELSPRAFMLCTDGIGDELGTGRTSFARWMGTFLAQPPDPLSFAYALSMRSRGASDDRGAAVAWLTLPDFAI